MIVGKSYLVLPEFTRGKERAGESDGQRMWGRCVWVHPKGRFAVLDFGVYGVSIRESFFPEELTGNAGR